LGLWLAGVVVAMFLVVPQYTGLGNAGRIIIMHVPTAWVTSVAFAVSAVYSLLYLRRRRSSDDAGAVAAAEVGFVFCILATVTGAIFAQIVWGVFWNWDPRETSILVLLLIYAAYFALRSAIDDVERRRRLSAVYNLFAAVTMPFLLFVAPRVADSSLHPNCAFLQGSKCDGITLQVGGARIGQLGDNVLELQALHQRGDLVVAQVQVRRPGLKDVAVLEPTYEIGGSPADRPQFPGQRFELTLKRADLATGTALLNVEAPGTGLLSNLRTLSTFLASIAGFTGLFVWLYRLRAEMLVLEERLAQHEGSYA
jgi:heme exporter protein C